MKCLSFKLGIFAGSLLAASVLAQPNPATAQKASVQTAEVIPFANGGSVHLKDTFGEVFVEGWDRNEVEVSLTRRTQKTYTAAAQASQLRRLEKIKLVTSKDAAGGLLVETKNIPFMKTNLALEYRVKVPQSILLKVKHGIGEVRIKNVVSDIEATLRIGALFLYLPEKERYDVDARVKIGEVESDFGGQYNRQKLLGAKLTDEAKRSEPHKLFLRVGIGEVSVRKMGN